MNFDNKKAAANKYEIKDKILKHLRDPRNGSIRAVSEISKRIGFDYNLVSYLSDELIEENFVEAQNIASKDHDVREDKSLIIKNKGIYFLEFEGGFKERENQDGLKKAEDKHRLKLLEDFHKTTAEKNQIQMKFFYLSIGTSIIAILTSIAVAILK